MVIPEIALTLSPDSPEANKVMGFQHAGGDIGKRSKLGGLPDWIQGENVPACSCGSSMSFYGQLDSIGDTVILADCGMIYVFVCFQCFSTNCILQSY